MIDLTISIVSWNSKDQLRECLQSIKRNVDGITFEVIVVDNDSNDGSSDLMKSDFPEFRLIENDSNAGFARANNQSLKIAKGRYFMLLNTDTIVLPGAIKKMVDFMDNNPQAGALGPRLIWPDGSLQGHCRVFPNLFNSFLSLFSLDGLFPSKSWRMTWWDHNDLREVDQPMGACLLVRKKAIDQAGELDERFFVYYEDVDWCMRIKKAGWSIFFLPDAKIIHYAGSWPLSLTSRIINEESRIKYFRKYFGEGSAIMLRILFFLSFLFLVTNSFPRWPFFSKESRGERKEKIKSNWIVMKRIWNV